MAALDGIFVAEGLVANSQAPGLKCVEALVADICTASVLPWANRVDLTTDFVIPTQWVGDALFTLRVPIAWLRGGEILVSRQLPIAWGARVSFDRLPPIAWRIPFIDVDRILSIAFSKRFAADRILALAWSLESLWIDQVAGEPDLWIDQVDGETDLWIDQVAGEADLWSKI